MTSILKIDVDYEAPAEWLSLWEKTRIIMLSDIGLTFIRMAKHETTKGQNYFIEIKESLQPEAINCLQFLLGDDHTRVKINAWRIERGIKHWNKIFDRKLWRKKQKTITCYYCGNVIPLIGMKDNERDR